LILLFAVVSLVVGKQDNKGIKEFYGLKDIVIDDDEEENII